MRYIMPNADWHISFGNYIVVAPSATVASEWDSFEVRQPERVAYAYEVLCTVPTIYVPGRIHQLRCPYKPLWNLWVTDQEVIYYYTVAGTETTGGIGVTVLVGVRNDVFPSPRLGRMVDARQSAANGAMEEAIAELKLYVDMPLRLPAWARDRGE
jgi:hypothetical protein